MKIEEIGTMSENSESEKLDVYEQSLSDETLQDHASQNLQEFPCFENKYIYVLYLQNNNISKIPDDFFPSLPFLSWLDLRSNSITEIPTSINGHQSLTHLLLQNNKLATLPNELGTVNLKVLQIHGNPLVYPPKEVLDAGTKCILKYLNGKFLEDTESEVCEDNISKLSASAQSYNSVLDCVEEKKFRGPLEVKFNEKETLESTSSVSLRKRTCPHLSRSLSKTKFSQSSKYVKTNVLNNDFEKLKQLHLQNLTRKRHSELLESREKIIQGRKNMESLRNWRQNYRHGQLFKTNVSYKFDINKVPYDINPEYLTLLSRDDIEKDLPDKYKKGLIKKCKPSVPRKDVSDVHLAMKIKQLFDNLEAINLNNKNMTPRTEQKMLLNEIQKISEIKQKLMELSITNKSTP